MSFDWNSFVVAKNTSVASVEFIVTPCRLGEERPVKIERVTARIFTWFKMQRTLVRTVAHLREFMTLSLKVRVSWRTALFSSRRNGFPPAAEGKTKWRAFFEGESGIAVSYTLRRLSCIPWGCSWLQLVDRSGEETKTERRVTLKTLAQGHAGSFCKPP